MSDSHIGPDGAYRLNGVPTDAATKRVIQTINALPHKPDFVIHTGDVVFDPDTKAYEHAAFIMQGLSVPVYYACGNHDSAQQINHHLVMAKRESLLTSNDSVCYNFEIKGYRFITLSLKPSKKFAHGGVVPDAQIGILKRLLATSAEPLTIFLHFPLLPVGSPWIDRDMLTENGEEIHALLADNHAKIKGVFFGHIHQSMQFVRDGVMYVSCTSTSCQFSAWASDHKYNLDRNTPIGFNYVTLTPNHTIVRQHSVPFAL